MKIGVTGANGMVGRACITALHERGHAAIAIVRREPDPPIAHAAETRLIDDVGPETEWGAALEGLDAVIHCAARAHVMRETGTDAEAAAAFRAVNRRGTAHLARACAKAGVKRLVFVSTIKVCGEETEPGQPFTAASPPRPEDAYARSKAAAEGVLAGIGAETGLEYVIVRPPLIYGPGAAGNFARLWRWAGRGLPLPLGAVNNRRTMAGVDNLADALALCCEHPKAAGKTYIAGDETISTAELVRRCAAAQGARARLWPVPIWALRFAAGALTGQSGAVRRLTGDLEADAEALRRDLGWTPRLTMIQSLERIAAAPRARR
ncbi:MAG: NAD-dependent epimerase/dehydratase family protein [Rhodospirillales bacterium]